MKKTFIEPEMFRIELNITENIAVSGVQYYNIPITEGLFHATYDSYDCIIVSSNFHYDPFYDKHFYEDFNNYIAIHNCFWIGDR